MFRDDLIRIIMHGATVEVQYLRKIKPPNYKISLLKYKK